MVCAQKTEILISVEQIKEICSTDSKCFKYVRVGENDFRFCPLTTNDLHVELVTEDEEVKKLSQSAGIIGIMDDEVSFVDKGSESLKVAWDSSDQKLIPELFGYTLKE